jgi:hypothetical protein
MITTFFKSNRPSVTAFLLLVLLLSLVLQSCKKEDGPGHPASPAAYPADVLDKWMTLQLRLMRNASGIPNHAFSRHFAYAGVAALESLAPGLPGQSKWRSRWNGLTGLPSAGHRREYYYPANVNAALATINRAMFPNANEADKMAIDSLEAALTESFLTRKSQSIITASAEYGIAVATAVFNWAENDGYKDANKPYTPPVGPGLWQPTPPAIPATPYWGNNRPVIAGSTDNTDPGAPFAYSTEPKSAFFQMVKHLYDVSQNLTEDQKAMAFFWRDIPGATSPGHWVSIVQQTVRKTKSRLDKAALAYALTGAALNDALISCFKGKYQYNLLRPVAYINEVMGYNSWMPIFGTPAHPEYPSAHASLSAAAAAVLQSLYGNIGTITDHTYDYLGFAPRTYASFTAIGEEAGQSRVYAGIHYEQTIVLSLAQGRKVAANILKGGSSTQEPF